MKELVCDHFLYQCTYAKSLRTKRNYGSPPWHSSRDIVSTQVLFPPYAIIITKQNKKDQSLYTERHLYQLWSVIRSVMSTVAV